MRAALAVAALAYVVAYVLAQRRRAAARVTVLCPLRAGVVPDDIGARLGVPRRIASIEDYTHAAFTIGYLTEAPGIAVAAVVDEASFDTILGPLMREPIFRGGRVDWRPYLSSMKWDVGALHELTLMVLHIARPRSLLVDLRTPPEDVARANRITTAAADVDHGMCAYEILCRLARYTDYRDARFALLFCHAHGAFVYEGTPASLCPSARA